MTSVATNECWPTPQDLWLPLNDKYQFSLDAAADQTNHKTAKWYGPGGEREDALSRSWPFDENIWCNPPYARGKQRKFVEKAIECAWAGGQTVMLLPADTSTRLFHELIWQRYFINFLPKRIRFSGAPHPAKFGSMLVEFSLKGMV